MRRGAEVQKSERRPLLVSKGWIQAVLLVVLFGFFVLGLLAYRTYMAKPPTPQRVADPSGQVLYTAADIHKGHHVFLHNGLMEDGSVFAPAPTSGRATTRNHLHRPPTSSRRSTA